ncbi:hypothetical protein MPH_09126 [Macrophomina phaseolina MS6]|uniref:SET domain-containing protein n=1 Tax=Macrophomina phaseolina (strain MS6) TaxID=1126212 RepID=K2QVF0_MACPH|nr:hypothetical protein MPH_09126 [Macrophomina phaseolina MS6]
MFPSNASADEPICAFVSSTFADGRGIALLTTPARVAEILSSEAFTEPQLPPDINDYTNPPFEERHLPGRGKGLIANKPLQSGDRLFASTPILMIDEAIDGLQKADRLKLSYHALRSLPESSQKKFWALAGHVDGADPFDDRVDTNSFGIELANAEFWVIFPEIARLNHDCRPNSAYFFDPHLLTQYVHTSSPGPVPAGTELTISYLDASLPRAARQRKLHANWGFPCTCSLCSLSPPLSRASDRRLARISELARKLGDWRAGSAAGVGMALALVDLVEAEGLRASLPDAVGGGGIEYVEGTEEEEEE